MPLSAGLGANCSAASEAAALTIKASDADGCVALTNQLHRFPKPNGLDDDKGQPTYRVGSINVHVT